MKFTMGFSGIFGLLAAICVSHSALAQMDDDSSNTSAQPAAQRPIEQPTTTYQQPATQPAYQQPTTQPATTSSGYQSSATPAASGELRGAHPLIMDPARPGYLQAGIGPSFAIGLGTDRPLYDLIAAYNYNFSEAFTGKVFGDFNMSSGADNARMITLGIGSDIYLQEVRSGYGIPYVMGDLGFAFAKSNNDRTQDAPAIGAGAGFKFAADEVNLDINLHYTVLTAQVDERTPSIVALRAAVNF